MISEALTVEKQFRQLAQLLSDNVFWVAGCDGAWRFVSTAYETLCGRNTDSLYKQPRGWLKAVHPADRIRLRNAIADLSVDGLDEMFRILHIDGSVRWCHVRGYPIKDTDGNVVILAGVIKDITRNKTVEQELLIKDLAIASSINGIAMCDLQGRLTYVNDAFANMWGFTDKAGLINRAATDFWESREAAQTVMTSVALSGAWHGELVARKADGNTFHTQLSAHLIKDENGEPIALMASFVDKTQQKQAEHIISESEQRFRNLVETTSDWVWEVDQNARYTYVSPRVYELLGYRSDELLGKTPFELMSAKEAERVKNLFNGYLTHKMPFANIENTNLHKDGSEVVLETSGQPFFGPEGEFRGYRGIDRDFTKRKRVQGELTEALRELGTIMNSVQDLIVKTDEKGKLSRWNAYAEQVTGYNSAQLHGHDISTLLREDDRGKAAAAVQKAFECGRAEVEVHIVHKDGSARLFHCIGVAVKDETGKVVALTAVGRDITQQRKAELALQQEKAEQEILLKRLQETQNQLLQSEKMASIGQLAAGVAHEINNPVGYINSNVSSLKQYVQDLFTVLEAYQAGEKFISDQNTLDAIHAVKQKVDLEFLKRDILDLTRESQEGVLRVKQIVQDLKDFSHVDQGEWSCADLYTGLDSTLNIVHNELKYKAQVVKEYGDLPHIECLASQLNQVFMNLLVNAAHAIDDHGIITVRTGVDNNTCGGGQWVWVQIADTGKGIAPEHLRRVFDPFFTTKPVGKGTGLGLSLSYGIVEKHGGHIEVISEPGRGSTFTVRLPVRQPEAKMAAGQ